MSQKPVDILLFCPECNTQHVDKAEPDNCESCGHDAGDHFNAGERNICGGGEWDGDVFSEAGCQCDGFAAWLNPPHKSHRCHSCNHVWRPFEYPTNGIAKSLAEQLEFAERHTK